MVELVIVIAISGIIAIVLAAVIRRPMMAVDDQIRRTELVDIAESALRRMQRDIRAAVPNSVRVMAFNTTTSTTTTDNVSCPANGTLCVIEIIHSVDGGRYRASEPGNSTNKFELSSTVAETEFDSIGNLQNIYNYTAAQIQTFSLVIGNIAASGTSGNAYFGDNRTLLTSVTNVAGPPSYAHVIMSPKIFPTSLETQRHRFFIADTPITYQCNTATGNLTRYQGYAYTAAQATTPAGGTNALAAQFVVGCRFTYVQGASSRFGLITLELTLQDTSKSTEQVRLVHQIHVYNVP
jgi:MSHA biogenesis protein MshO